MSLRTRLLLAFAAVVLIPIALLAFGLRQEMSRRLSAEYQRRVDGVVEVIREDLARESAGIAERLASLERALVNDNRFRLGGGGRRRNGAGVSARLRRHGDAAHRPLDAPDPGWRRIGSSARVTSGTSTAASSRDWLSALEGARGVAFVTARGAEQEFLALARARRSRSAAAGLPWSAA